MARRYIRFQDWKEQKRILDTVEALMKACAHGPFNPRLRCGEKGCPYWKDCVIGNEI